MNEHATLTPAQHLAIESLLLTGNIAAAAKKAGINRNTLYRWMAEPEFREALDAAQSAALGHVILGLTGLGESAILALQDALLPKQAIGTRLKAAETVIDKLMKMLASRAPELSEADSLAAEERDWWKAVGDDPLQ